MFSRNKTWLGYNKRVTARSAFTLRSHTVIAMVISEGFTELPLCSEQQLRTAVEQTVALGCHDSAAVRHLAAAHQLQHRLVAPLQLGLLAQFDRPLPKVADYDQLLVGGARR